MKNTSIGSSNKKGKIAEKEGSKDDSVNPNSHWGKDLENFDLKRLPFNLARRIKSLLTADLIDNRENLLIFGNPGSGKTHLVCVIGQHLIKEHDHRVHFTSSMRLVQELLIAKQNYQLPRMIKRLTTYNALIPDSAINCEFSSISFVP